MSLHIELCAMVISGDVGCWSDVVGFLVGVFVFRGRCVEFCMRSAMMLPLWSFVGENQ